LSPKKSVVLLKALRNSSLYRADQQSYILYPNRHLPHFYEKNIIPTALVNESKVISRFLREDQNNIIDIDVDGKIHFDSKFRNAGILKQELQDINELSNQDIQEVLDIYEAIFDHQSFTGRSGTFFKYEGLGSIYWHMVSKLLLAVNDLYLSSNSDDEQLLTELKSIYYDIREGIGIHKNPGLYGAFPTDPYSHTPAHCGVQQPGMTGQVKEDFISRFGELGVQISNGKISFQPSLLEISEFIESDQDFSFYDIRGKKGTISLKKNSLAFTLAQVPIIYTLSEQNSIRVNFNNNSVKEYDGLDLCKEVSNSVFNREGKVIKIEVNLIKV